MRVIGALVVVVLLAIAGFVWATTPSAGAGEALVAAKTPYTKGKYYLYLQPWGGESYGPTQPWSPHADAAVVPHGAFPDYTEISWRWPPMRPGNDVGVWAYDALSYGSYDGGQPEIEVAPIQVKDLKTLSQTFTWSLTNDFGDANVLTEFYLDTPGNPAKHKVEIGFFLHAPAVTRQFFESAPRLVGSYVDEQGRQWKVRMGGTFCMFARDGYEDVNAGSIDMLHALRWLQGKGVVDGSEMMPGLAIGVEPVGGFGHLKVDRWKVVMN